MKQVTFNLYSFSELSKEAQKEAIEEHRRFLDSVPEEWENEDGTMSRAKVKHTKAEVIESIEINDYLFFEDGELAHCTTYTGKHPKSGITVFHFRGKEIVL